MESLLGDPIEITIIKAAHYGTEESFSRSLMGFMKDTCARLCFIMIDMAIISKRMINRIRQLIENIDGKIFVLLLHYPSGMESYCTLFLNGWNFYYFDSIAGKENHCNVCKKKNLPSI